MECPVPAPAPTEADLDPAFPERDRLRRENRVQLVNAQEEGSGVSRVSNGAYGFTYAPLAESPLFAKRDHHSFEVHRLPDGSVRVIAFVSAADAERIRAAREEFETRIYPDTFADATEMIAIPVERLHTRKMLPSREPGNWIAATVYPA